MLDCAKRLVEWVLLPRERPNVYHDTPEDPSMNGVYTTFPLPSHHRQNESSKETLFRTKMVKDYLES
jgi:hypothetical protein